MQNGTPITKNWSKWKPEVEFRRIWYSRLFSETGSSYISAVDCDILWKWWITVVSVSLSSAGAWSMGSITVVIGVSETLMASFIPPHSGFLGWWQGIMTNPLKVLKNTTTCSSWSQKAISTWVSTTCSMFSVFFATPSSACSGMYSFHQELLTTHVCCRTNRQTYTQASTQFHHALILHWLLGFLCRSWLCRLSFKWMQANKVIAAFSCNQVGDSGQSCTHYTVESGTMNQFGRLFQFPPCQRFFSLLLDKTYIETRSFLAGYSVWWVLKYTAGARISRWLALFI